MEHTVGLLRTPTQIWLVVSLVLSASLALGGCQSEVDPEKPLAIAVPDGKVDDYLSPTSREYRLSGVGSYTLPESWVDEGDEDKQEHAEQMLGYKFKAYSFYVNLYVTDRFNHTIRKIEISSGMVSTIAGRVGSLGPADGIGLLSMFMFPAGIASDGTNLYVADTDNNGIRIISP